VADVVLKLEDQRPSAAQIGIEQDILQHCREALPRHKVPAAIGVVPTLAVAATGKLVRRR
jgi:acyl-CoA synthetase (AMP-forming)/AMP-acid ligase II